MARIDDLPLWLRATLKVYPWRRVEPVPGAPLVRPLDACTVALVTTAGLVPPGEAPFDSRVRGGDVSFRVIGGEAAGAGPQGQPPRHPLPPPPHPPPPHHPTPPPPLPPPHARRAPPHRGPRPP